MPQAGVLFLLLFMQMCPSLDCDMFRTDAHGHLSHRAPFLKALALSMYPHITFEKKDYLYVTSGKEDYREDI